jgi:hypothetical protein
MSHGHFRFPQSRGMVHGDHCAYLLTSGRTGLPAMGLGWTFGVLSYQGHSRPRLFAVTLSGGQRWIPIAEIGRHELAFGVLLERRLAEIVHNQRVRFLDIARGWLLPEPLPYFRLSDTRLITVGHIADKLGIPNELNQDNYIQLPRWITPGDHLRLI